MNATLELVKNIGITLTTEWHFSTFLLKKYFLVLIRFHLQELQYVRSRVVQICVRVLGVNTH